MQEDIKLRFPGLFWDTDNLDIKQHQKFIVERILESGTSEMVKFLFETYSEQEIKEIIRSSNRISVRTALFWQARLNITETIKCIQRRSIPMQKDHWNI